MTEQDGNNGKDVKCGIHFNMKSNLFEKDRNEMLIRALVKDK